MLDKYSYKVNGVRTFLSNAEQPDIASVTPAERASIVAALPAYTQTLTSSLQGNAAYFAVQDVARRLNAGLGSYGVTRCGRIAALRPLAWQALAFHDRKLVAIADTL